MLFSSNKLEIWTSIIIITPVKKRIFEEERFKICCQRNFCLDIEHRFRIDTSCWAFYESCFYQRWDAVIDSI